MLPGIPPWNPPPETTSKLDWAPLISIDLSEFDSSPQTLAAKLQTAATTDGFWTVINSGIPQEAIDEQFSIADAFFKLSLEEKRAVCVDYATERHFGYQEPREIIKDGQSIKQNVERVNIPKISPNAESSPKIPLHDFTTTHRSSIASFQRLCYDNVLKKLLMLFAIMLELPEEYFLEKHRFEDSSEDHIRMMKYHARPEDVDRIVSGQWIAGHTDFGSITLLFPQPIAALQIQTPSKEWKWVKPVKGGITCNAGDVLSFLTKGYIKSAIHRVIRPPPDQAHLDRLSLIYFLRPGNEVPIVPAISPVLLKEGLVVPEEGEREREREVVRGGEYVRARVKHVNDRYTWRVDESKPDKVFSVKGISVRDYYV